MGQRKRDRAESVCIGFAAVWPVCRQMIAIVMHFLAGGITKHSLEIPTVHSRLSVVWMESRTWLGVLYCASVRAHVSERTLTFSKSLEALAPRNALYLQLEYTIP